MKVTMEVDCTPEEARRVMGLPDVSPLHDRYVKMLQETMEQGVRPEAIEAIMKSWAPMGDAGMALWRRMLETGSKPGG